MNNDTILQGIPQELPPIQIYDMQVNHAPKRKDILSIEEKNWLSEMLCDTFMHFLPKELL